MLLVIGLDGATFDLLTPWMEAGYLPTLARLVETGVSAPLRSTTPPVTAPAWSTFMTGKNPGKHGVFDFFKPNTSHLDTPELVTADSINGRLFWDYLSDAGVKVGILNVPVTYPPRPVNGFLVPGLLSPDEGATTFPIDFLKPYHAELGDYRIVPHLPYQPDNVADFVAELHAVTETQINYALRIAQDHPVDFLMVHFFTPDLAQHKLWRYLDATHPWHNPAEGKRWGTVVRDIFARIDAAIAQLLIVLPEKTAVIVMSDHGFGAQHKTVNLNNFFIQTGLMQLKNSPSVRLRAAAARLPGLLMRIATKMVRKSGRQHLLGYADVDWMRTVAYSRGHIGQIYLNMQGRELHGIVPPADYLAVREQVMETLLTLRHPEEKRPLIDHIIPREEASDGMYTERGPDLHLVMDAYRILAYPMFAANGRLFTPQTLSDSGNHRPNGIFIAAGDMMKPTPPDHDVSPPSLTDLAPTILHLLDVPVPDDMDGRVLTEFIHSEFMRQHPIASQKAEATSGGNKPTLTAIEQANLAERLRQLGYLGGKSA